MAGQEHRSAANLTLDDIRADVVLSFLDYLESERGNTAATRNYRLAVLRSFARHLLRNDSTHAEQYGRILALPSKRATSRPATYLEPEDARAMISAVEPRPTAALRDRALLLFLYNTGARVSEALSVSMQQLRLNPPRQVRLFGKGQKSATVFCGRKRTRHYVKSPTLSSTVKRSSETPKARQSVATASHTSFKSTCAEPPRRYHTCDQSWALLMGCGTVVPSLSSRQASIYP